MLIRLYRVSHNKDLREMGKDMGITAAGVLRIEQGQAMRFETFVKVLNWLTNDSRKRQKV